MHSIKKLLLFFIEFSTTVITLIISILLAFVISWGLNKGFDFSDEGFLLSGYTMPVYSNTGSLYQKLFYYLFKPFHPGLLFYRGLRFVLSIGATLLCYIAMIRYLHFENFSISRITKLLLLTILLIGILSSYSIFTAILSYNSISAIISISVIVILLYQIIKGAQTSIYKLNILAGFLLSYLYFVRFPTAILLIGIYILSILVLKNNYRKKSTQLCIFICSILLFHVAFIYCFYETKSTEPWYTYYSDHYSLIQSMKEHNPEYLLQKNREQLRYVYDHSIQPYTLFLYLISALYGLYYFFKKRWLLQLSLVPLIWILYNAIIWIIKEQRYKSGVVYNHVAFEPILFLGICYLIWNLIPFVIQNIYHIKKYLLILILIAMPFICSIGSNNDIPVQLLQHLIFWTIGMALLYVWNKKETIIRIGNLAILCVWVLLLSAQTWYGYTQYPYRIDGSLQECITPLSGHKLHNIYSTISMQQSLLAFHKIIDRYPNKDQSKLKAIDFCKLQGMLYSVNAYTPRNAWIGRNTVKANEYIINSLQSKTHSKFDADIIILPQFWKNDSAMCSYLSIAQKDFFTTYTFADSMQHPLYNYSLMPQTETIYIYFKPHAK